jgi:hypothetical protein
MTLAELQQDFRTWLVTASDDTVRRFGDAAAPGLAVYQNNYRASLVACLKASYPLVRGFIGGDAFLQAAIAHIDAHPPHAWTLDAYGDDFAETLVRLFPRNPDIHELAWIEWSLGTAFVAADVDPIDTATLADMEWDEARLGVSPTLRERAATTNAAAIWLALQDGEDVPEGEMLDAPAGLIVWRTGFNCRVKQVDAVERAALAALREDDRFPSLCDMLVDRLGEDEGIARAGTLLADWLGAGIVVTVARGALPALRPPVADKTIL